MCFVLLLNVLISVQDDDAVEPASCGSAWKDELPEPRGSLANNKPSRAIEQANQEV